MLISFFKNEVFYEKCGNCSSQRYPERDVEKFFKTHNNEKLFSFLSLTGNEDLIAF